MLTFVGNDLDSFVIPSSITRLEDSCFSGRRNLVSITFPENFSNIGRYMFQNVGLSAMTFYIDALPPSFRDNSYNVYSQVQNNGIVRCPAGRADSGGYRAFISHTDNYGI